MHDNSQGFYAGREMDHDAEFEQELVDAFVEATREQVKTLLHVRSRKSTAKCELRRQAAILTEMLGVCRLAEKVPSGILEPELLEEFGGAFSKRSGTLLERYAYATECQMATLDTLKGSRRSPKTYVGRMEDVVGKMVAVVHRHGMTAEQARRVQCPRLWERLQEL